MQIFLARNNQQAGPYTLEQLNQMLAEQQVLLTDLMWHHGMTEWKTLAEATQGQLHYTPPQPNIVNRTAPVVLEKQPTIEIQPIPTTPQLATLPQRAAAKAIDLALWLPMTLMPSALMSLEQQRQLVIVQEKMMEALMTSQVNQAQAYNLQFLQLIPNMVWIVMGLYFILMLVGQAWLVHRSGQTVGKKVMGVHIVAANTFQRVGVMRGFVLRSGLFIFLNLLTNFLVSLVDYGFAMGAKRQTLHDRIARTQVTIKPIAKNK